ncbi:MAG: serine--tRNA ligase [Candidatus Aureabacteria bacterium]|nr:serine--tRNA ligase [Candidatus Auribacterota bacterium]
MLDLKFIRENVKKAKEGLKKKNSKVDLDEILKLDERRRELLKEVEVMKADRNRISKELGISKSKGEDISQKSAEMKAFSQKIKDIDFKVEETTQNINAIMLTVPNIPNEAVPVGSEANNKTVKEWEKKKNFNFKPLPHWELCEKLDMVDFKRASKISGAGFVVFKGKGALLERALINFMLDVHIREHGYKEVVPPFLVNEASMTGTGQLPNLKEDMYSVDKEGLYLIPTAEVPVTNLYAGEIFSEEDLPLYHVSFSACFRKEAGSYGKDTRGMKRVHQFDKVELVKFVLPEASYEEHEKLLGDAETILQKLGLHYRVRLLASGDMSFAAAKCYDIEVYSPGCNEYLEVSSCSNFEDFQARRANIRYRARDGKRAYVHTLNASGIALPRTFIAVLENCQTEDGKIAVPDVLRPYMGGLEYID